MSEAKSRSLGWMKTNHLEIEHWIEKLRNAVKHKPTPLIKPIKEFQQMVYSDPILYGNVQGMFADAHRYKKNTPLGWQPQPLNFEEFLELLNAIMCTAPEAYQSGRGKDQDAAGMIGFPINALLNWPMATPQGYDVFSNALVNQQLKKILVHWSRFLTTKDSRYVLVEGDCAEDVIAWLSPHAQAEMVSVAYNTYGDGPNPVGKTDTFADIFQCQPNEEYYGYKSWDDFFTRQFHWEKRPVSEPDNDNVITNACESAPFDIARDVALSAPFWLKGQKYSLENMLNFDEFTPQFVGGTVYQAFLSALSFHRWHSPVNGTIVKAYVVNGSYYLENLAEGFFHPIVETEEDGKVTVTGGPDSAAPNDSQPFLSAVATRAVIFIEADNPAIGLMCVMPIGMAEVSSCQITVKAGDRVKKGQEIGMFHFGGSTHCLIFRKGVDLDFFTYGATLGPDGDTNIRVNTKIAEVKV